MTTSLPTIKRGDSFVLSCTYKEDGEPVDLTVFTITSQVRDSSGVLVEEFTAELLDQETNPGVFTLTSADPSLWPIDELACDIQFMKNGVTRSTQTFLIPVEPDVTRA